MSKSVAVVDYGAGNILNVLRAFASLDIDTDLVADPEQLRRHSHIVLPGVGAFDYGMRNLTRSGLGDEIVALVADGRPVLGICLGMQLLAERGFENGLTPGLGLIRGDIAHLNELSVPGGEARVPRTGWSSVAWADGLRSNPLATLTTAYFNHSFYLSNPEGVDVLATTAFGAHAVPVAIRAGSIFATQFHPEKSGQAGVSLLRRWVMGPKL
jgi:glutamine amidotransferase